MKLKCLLILMLTGLILCCQKCPAHDLGSGPTTATRNLRTMIRTVFDQDTITTAQLNQLLNQRNRVQDDLNQMRVWLRNREKELNECDAIIQRFAGRLQGGDSQ